VELPSVPAGSEFKLIVFRRGGRVDWEPLAGNRTWPSVVASAARVCLRYGEVGCTVEEPKASSKAGYSQGTKTVAISVPEEKVTTPKLQLTPKESSTGTSTLRERFILTSGDSFGKNSKLEERFEMDCKELGSGAFGSVCKAKDKSTGAVRAIKSIVKAQIPDVKMLQKEIELTKTMDHPNIVKLFATFEEERMLYLVMELCTGGELFDRIVEAGHLAEPTVLKLMKQMFGAISYCHARDVVHRDLKPENFILQTKDPVDQTPMKLIDFGLSDYCGDGEALSDPVGTPCYVAPEVLGKKYGKPVDIWSLGVIMYCLLCGSPPFSGSTDAQLLARIKRGNYSLDGSLWFPVTDAAKDLIRQSLEMDSRKRITAVQALEHAWLKQAKFTADVKLHNDIIENLKAFSLANRFKKAALTAVAYNLSEDEQETLREAFVSLDTNGDGFLTLEELQKGVESNCKMLEGVNLEQVMAAIDANHDGRLEYTEFIAAAMDEKVQNHEDMCWRAFKAFDANNDGKISLDEMNHVLQEDEMEHTFPGSRKASFYFKRMDQDGDGEVCFEEFLHMLRASKTPKTPPVYKSKHFGDIMEEIQEIECSEFGEVDEGGTA